MRLPRGSQKTDWEVELGVVIGRGGSYIAESDALAHVAGSLGPWLVTPDEIADPHRLPMWLDVDGRRMQNGSTATMVYRIPFLISYLSRFMSLQSGDVIATGTPPGVGMGHKPPVYLQAGQTMRLGIEGLGVQTQRVVQG